jgi:ABC-type nitrate/sulfonate/bicarbonate transport system substrate-binding protein
MRTIRRILLAVFTAAALSTAAAAQNAPEPPLGTAAGVFIDVIPSEGHAPVRLAVAQVVRVARVEHHTIIDTTAWVQ